MCFMGAYKRIRKEVLAINILIPLLVGGVSALLTGDNRSFYRTIERPSFAPPGFLFPIVWTILYILMGISSYLIYESGSEDRKKALITYGIQLAMNFAWSFFFFCFRAFLFSFIWLVLLWIAIIVMIVQFAKINRVAAYLQIPYLLWVTFAGVLNFAIYLLNK